LRLTGSAKDKKKDKKKERERKREKVEEVERDNLLCL